MQILSLVVTFLLLLSMMTYARFSSYRSLFIAQKAFEVYSQKRERAAFNQIEEDWYKKSVFSKDAKGEKKKSAPPQALALLNWSYLLDEKLRSSHSQRAEQIRNLSKNLMIVLFKNRAFFQKALAENPSILEDLLAAIEKAADQLPKARKIKKIEEVSQLVLDKGPLNELFYRLLKETEKPAEDSSRTKEEDKNETAPQRSLLSYLTLHKKASALRLYLAPLPLLEALFGNEEVAREAEQERQELYQTLKSVSDEDKEKTKSSLSQQFEARFKGSVPAAYQDFVNFEVSGSDPRAYNKGRE